MNNILNKITSFFLKESESKNVQETSYKQKNKTDMSQVVKTLFTKTDTLSMTEFPYQWNKDFFPPLNEEERKYMTQEIMRWYNVYLDIYINKIVEAIILMALKPSSKNELAVKYNQEYPEHFYLMVQDIVQSRIYNQIKEKIDNFNDDYLINWKPIEGDESWEPPSKDIAPILKEISKTVISESEIQLEQQITETKRIVEEQKRIIKPEDKKEALIRQLEDYLSKHKKEIIKHCHDKILYEWNSFPMYYGKMEKVFKNNLYNKYSRDLGFYNFTSFMSKPYNILSSFIRTHGKNEVKKWVEEQWDEFTYFMEQEYMSLEEEDVLKLNMEEDFNKYAFSIDYFVLMIFKINSDGM